MGVNFLLFLYYLLMTRVLLAEDDTSISEPLSRALRREGYEVDVTADGPSTLDKALGEHDSEGVQQRVEPLDALQVQLQQLARRDLSGRDQLGLAGDPGEGEVGRFHRTSIY